MTRSLIVAPKQSPCRREREDFSFPGQGMGPVPPSVHSVPHAEHQAAAPLLSLETTWAPYRKAMISKELIIPPTVTTDLPADTDVALPTHWMSQEVYFFLFACDPQAGIAVMLTSFSYGLGDTSPEV